MALIDNCIRYFKCDENAANTTVVDATGTADATAATNTSNLSIAGIINTAFDYDGSTEYVDTNYQVPDIASNKTVNYWIKTTDQGLAFGLAAYDGNDYEYFGRLNSIAAEKIEFGIYDGTNQTWIEKTSTGFEDGNWHMLTFVQSGNTANDLKIYLDGSDTSAGVTIAGTLNADAVNRDLFIAARNDQGNDIEHLDGIIDEVGIWSRALSPAEVSELWNSGNGLAYPFTTPAAGNSQMMSANF